MALALVVKISLAGISEGWDERAYFKFKPFGHREHKSIQKKRKELGLKSNTDAKDDLDKGAALGEATFDMLKQNFLEGKVYRPGGDDFVLSDATADDIIDIFYLVPDRFMVMFGQGDTGAPKKKR